MKQIILNVSCLTVVGLSLAMVLLLLNGGFKMLSVQSNSMVPTFHRGSLVLVKKESASNYRVGDIVTYADPDAKGSTITHRIIRVDSLKNGQPSGLIFTKGDANRTADSAVGVRSIVGKVRLSLPYVGYAYNFLIHPAGLLLVIYSPAIWIIVAEVINLARYYKSREPYISSFFIKR